MLDFPSLHLQLINKVVFVVSFVGNNGTFIMGYKAMVMDVEFLYHLAYVLTSTLGLFVHELFYSILVGVQTVKLQEQPSFSPKKPRLSSCAAVRPDLSGGDSVQRDQERDSQRTLHPADGAARSHPRLPLLHRGFPLSERGLHHGGGPSAADLCWWVTPLNGCVMKEFILRTCTFSQVPSRRKLLRRTSGHALEMESAALQISNQESPRRKVGAEKCNLQVMLVSPQKYK